MGDPDRTVAAVSVGRAAVRSVLYRESVRDCLSATGRDSLWGEVERERQEFPAWRPGVLQGALRKAAGPSLRA
jgi:hypothetical protein